MKNRKMLKGMLILAMCVLFAASAYAEVTTSYGAAFRLRQETWDNLFDMNEADVPSTSPFSMADINFWRLKTTPWVKVDIDQRYGFYARLCNEARYYMSTDNAPFRKYGLNKDEVVIDNLYVSANRFMGLPLDLTIGRQDFLNVFGEGFLVMDGTPVDGSRTFYFNAARATLNFSDRYNVDMVYLFTQNVDDALPSLYSSDDYNHPASDKRILNTSDEVGAIVYGRSKVADNLNVEPYYIYKREDTPDTLKLHTLGARAVYSFGDGWQTRGEYAHQFGEYDSGKDRSGDGGYAYIGRKFANVPMQPSFDLGYAYLSGDDPNTTKDEKWDPLFSRVPWWSELYSLSYARETGIADYWTNLSALRAQFRFVPAADTGIELSYSYIMAPENLNKTVIDDPNTIFSSGDKKGDLITAKLSHSFSKTLSGYVLVEDFVPGDFYKSTNRDNAMFVRWELLWKI